MIDLMTVLYVMLIAFVMFVMYFFCMGIKDTVYDNLYGIRYRTAYFIDLRKSVKIVLTKDLKEFTYNNITYIWNFQKDKFKSCIYRTDMSEPMEIDGSIA